MAEPNDPIEDIRARWSNPRWGSCPQDKADVHALLLRIDGLTEQLRAEQAMHRQEINQLHKEHARDIRDACAQARDDAAYDAREREGGY